MFIHLVGSHSLARSYSLISKVYNNKAYVVLAIQPLETMSIDHCRMLFRSGLEQACNITWKTLSISADLIVHSNARSPMDTCSYRKVSYLESAQRSVLSIGSCNEVRDMSPASGALEQLV
ncbi:hypothetical protein VNO77_25749 [Canavalia gladiata]|uniref:Uncharacterized protein n=1 Tax=Canavalia gladiata TaxID=3824 RepID=A0AAN9Q2U3_CANGL